MVLFAGNSVSSISEHVKGVREDALYISTLPTIPSVAGWGDVVLLIAVLWVKLSVVWLHITLKHLRFVLMPDTWRVKCDIIIIMINSSITI